MPALRDRGEKAEIAPLCLSCFALTPWRRQGVRVYPQTNDNLARPSRPLPALAQRLYDAQY